MHALNVRSLRLKYHPDAYRFLFTALRWTQEQLGRAKKSNADTGSDPEAHVSGQELVEGIRLYAIEQFGLMAKTVFQSWNVTRTDDFGHMVFEMIDRGEMSRTDSDHLEDFCGQYDFNEAFDRQYEIKTAHLFKD